MDVLTDTSVLPSPPPSTIGVSLKSSKGLPNPLSQTFADSILKLKPSDFKFHEAHLKEKVNEHEHIPTDLPDSNSLLELFKTTEITSNDLDLWANYSGGKMFESKSQLESPLKTIVEYCETSDKTSEGLKNKLRLINDKLQKKEIEPIGILILLAAHGGMCNVQKEVGVRMAFSFVNGSIKQEVEHQSLPTHVKKMLKNVKEVVTEKTFLEVFKGNEKNSHNIIPFRNELAPHIGLDLVPDPQPFFTTKYDEKWLAAFLQHYSPEIVIQHIFKAVNDEPRKIPYEPLVEYLKGSFPKEVDSYEVLAECFDENGKVAVGAIIHLLKHMQILAPM